MLSPLPPTPIPDAPNPACWTLFYCLCPPPLHSLLGSSWVSNLLLMVLDEHSTAATTAQFSWVSPNLPRALNSTWSQGLCPSFPSSWDSRPGSRRPCCPGCSLVVLLAGLHTELSMEAACLSKCQDVCCNRELFLSTAQIRF